MAIVSRGWVSEDEVARRVGGLQMKYAGDPLINRLDHRLGLDWSGDPAIFIDVVLAPNFPTDNSNTLTTLAEKLRLDLLSVVRSDEIGLHSYLSFVS
jgi:hypothetical protein